MDIFDKAIQDVILPLREAGLKAYIAGGAVRDRLLGEPARDVDIATNADAATLKNILGASGVRPDTYLVRAGAAAYEISLLKGSDIKEDCGRRDFTINSLAMDMDGSILDFTNGTTDIKNRILRATMSPVARFTEDPVRILRGIRFAAQYTLAIEDETKNAMRAFAHVILQEPAERILGELVKMMKQGGGKFARCLRLMAELGILDVILPEVARLREFEDGADTHPEGNPFEHTLKSLEICAYQDPDILMAILLHDVGKGVTCACGYKKDKNAWRHTYCAQDIEDIALIECIGKRLKFSVKMTECAKYCARYHMLPARARDIKTGKLLRIMASPYFAQLIKVCECDMLSRGRGADMAHVAAMREYMASLAYAASVAKEVTGKTVMDAIGLEAGPPVGEILENIRVFIVERILKTRKKPSHEEIMRRLAEMQRGSFLQSRQQIGNRISRRSPSCHSLISQRSHKITPPAVEKPDIPPHFPSSPSAVELPAQWHP